MIRIFALALALATFVGGVSAQEPARVGSLGDPSALVFEGNTAFTAKQIRDGLAFSPGFWIAAHPDAPLSDFQRDLTRLVRDGYLHAGFGDVQVTVHPGAGRIRVAIIEGVRYLAAAPVVRGGDALPVERVLAELAKLWAKEDDNVARWVPGEPAPLDRKAQEALEEGLRQVLADLGRHAVRLRLEVKLDREAATAQPVIHVLDPGPPGTIRSIDVRGTTRDTRERVIELLGLAPGAVANRALVSSLEEKLRASARFATHRVEVEPVEGGTRLVVHLVDAEGVPPLGEALPEKMKVVLRFRDWLRAFPDSDEELRLVIREPQSGLAGEVVLDPDRGCFLSAKHEVLPGRYSLLLGAQDYVLASEGGRLILRGRTGESGIRILIGLAVAEKVAGEQLLTFRLGALLATDVEGSRVGMQIDGAPAAFAKLAERADSFSVADGEAVFAMGDGRLTIDAASGRLKSFQGPLDGGSIRLDVTKGALETARSRQAHWVRDYLEIRNPESWLGGLLEFLVLDRLRDGMSPRPNARLPGKILSAAVRAPLSRHAFPAKSPFGVPRSFSPEGGLFGPEILPFTVTLGNVLFPDGSWPRDLAREAALVFAGRGQRTGDVLNRLLESERVGPLGHLVTALLLKTAESPAASRFAQQGLIVATPEGFEKDIDVLVHRGGAIGRYLRGLTTALRELDPDERKALEVILNDRNRMHLQAILEVLAKTEDEELATRQGLRVLWRRGLESEIQAALRSLAKD